MLFFSCSKVLCRYIYNTIGINVKGNLNLRNASSCWRDPIQTELSKGLVIPCQLTLAPVSYTHLDVRIPFREVVRITLKS